MQKCDAASGQFETPSAVPLFDYVTGVYKQRKAVILEKICYIILDIESDQTQVEICRKLNLSKGTVNRV